MEVFCGTVQVKFGSGSAVSVGNWHSGAAVAWGITARPARTKKARAALCTTPAYAFRRIITYRSDRDLPAHAFLQQRHRCPANPPTRSHTRVAGCFAGYHPGK